MLNSEIKYKTSTDYNELYKLLKDGNIMIGYIAIGIHNETASKDYSKLVHLVYDEMNKCFDLGFFVNDCILVNVGGFEKLCSQVNLRYIPFN